jgi:hypothetical protein
MTAAAGVEVHHRAPRCLLVLFDAAATGGLAEWSEFDAERMLGHRGPWALPQGPIRADRGERH